MGLCPRMSLHMDGTLNLDSYYIGVSHGVCQLNTAVVQTRASSSVVPMNVEPQPGQRWGHQWTSLVMDRTLNLDCYYLGVSHEICQQNTAVIVRTLAGSPGGGTGKCCAAAGTEMGLHPRTSLVMDGTGGQNTQS